MNDDQTDTPTKAMLFACMNPTIELPRGARCAVLILVFDDDSLHTSIPKGTPEEAEIALKSAMDLHGIGDGEHAELLTVSTPFLLVAKIAEA